MPTAPQVVDEWHRLLDARDLDGLTSLVADEVEIAGPRGNGRVSAEDVRDWVVRSGIRLRPRRTYQRGDAVVVEQAARWLAPSEGTAADEVEGQPSTEQIVFTAFRVEAGRITRLLRFDALAPALEVLGLTEADLTT